MSLAIGHFAIGVGLAALILTLFYKKLPKKWTIKWDVIIIFASGLWAIIPDYPKLYSDYVSTHPLWMNIFWGHTIIDKIYPDTALVSAGFIFFGVCLLALYWINLQ